MVIKIMKNFINREKELKCLEERLNSNKFELIIIYGRRRIGKTSLVLKAIENKKHIYYLATESDNLRKFKEIGSKTIEILKDLKDDWEAIFKVLSKENKLIIVIDEFPYLIKENKSIVSIFQRIVDLYLQNSNIKLVLLGSSISMMSDEILAYKSPLYGRKTSVLKIKKLKFRDFCKFFKNKNIHELIEIFGFCDGVPYYIKKIDGNKNFWVWLQDEINKIDSFIKYEVDFILKTEFENLRIYKRILEAISWGKTTRKEIKDFAQLQNIDISQYLVNLMETEFIVRKKPLFGKERDGRYYLSDNFLKFWFRYIYPNLSLIEEGIFDVREIQKDYSTYLGEIFEDVCLEYVFDIIKPKSIGKQWGRIPKKLQKENKTVYEIDIVSYDDSKLIFGECKWKDKINPKQICKELIEKIQYVDIPNNLKNHKIKLWIFAKSFKEKITEFEDYEVKCIDLNNLESTIRK